MIKIRIKYLYTKDRIQENEETSHLYKAHHAV